MTALKPPTPVAKLITVLIASFSLGTTVLAEPLQPTPARQLEVTVVKGSQLTKLLNEESKDYSLMAVVDGLLAPIPYQFDDKNTRGLTHVPGGKLPVDGAEGIIEEKDELVFMYKDMGEQITEEVREQFAVGTIISELEISEKNSTRYAYIIEGNSERSDKVYASYDMDSGLVSTEYYSLQLSPNNILVWSDWKINGMASTSAPSVNVLDTMKIRIKARLGFIKATIHNSLVPISTLAVKNGPVRAVIEADASLSMLGVNLAKAGVSTTFTAQTIEYPVFAAIPKAAGVLSALDITVTLDHVNLEGSRYRTALGPKEPLITSTKESGEIKDQYTMDLENPWVTISSGKNWDMFFFFFHEEDFEPTLGAVYNDAKAGDKVDKPERYKGTNTEMGIALTDVPVGVETSLHCNLYFGPDLWQGNNPEAAAHDILNPAQVRIN